MSLKIQNLEFEYTNNEKVAFLVGHLKMPFKVTYNFELSQMQLCVPSDLLLGFVPVQFITYLYIL